eukprot:TRINITY_DN2309_c0_g1_i7.p1 TRINITY_DN2309_c0_g1~~TRINITY_DN2309_c0_g1_i7.p1  ORF type:complete len:536 (+),score=75.58 TRINITY_DN2309_c0_g1_i7:244-1851(+)
MSSRRDQVEVLFNDKWYKAVVLSRTVENHASVRYRNGTTELDVEEDRLRFPQVPTPQRPRKGSASTTAVVLIPVLPKPETSKPEEPAEPEPVVVPAPTEPEPGLEPRERCGVCSEPWELEFEGAGDCDELMLCEVCDQAVHRTCFGGADFRIPQDSWVCGPCLNRVSEEAPPVCLLCLRSGGLLKPTTCDRWCHVSCMLATRNPSQCAIGYESGVWDATTKIKVFTDTESESWKSVSQSFKGTCSVCEKSTGFVVCCSHYRCTHTFHPSCAIATGLESWLHCSRADVLVRSSNNCRASLLFCGKHTLTDWFNHPAQKIDVARVHGPKKRRGRAPAAPPPQAESNPGLDRGDTPLNRMQFYQRRCLNPTVREDMYCTKVASVESQGQLLGLKAVLGCPVVIPAAKDVHITAVELPTQTPLDAARIESARSERVDTNATAEPMKIEEARSESEAADGCVPQKRQKTGAAREDAGKDVHIPAVELPAQAPLDAARIESARIEEVSSGTEAVSYTHLRAHETVLDLVCRLLLEKKKKAT